MDYDAEIMCRKTEYGNVCEWKGPQRGVAKFYVENLRILGGNWRDEVNLGNVLTYGRLKLRIVNTFDLHMSGRLGVMLESPHAQLYWFYREKAEKLVLFIRRCELAVRAFQGTLRIGETLPLTSQLADKLL